MGTARSFESWVCRRVARSDGVEFFRGSTRDNVFRQFNTNLEEISGMIKGASAWLSISYRHSGGYPPEMVISLNGSLLCAPALRNGTKPSL